MPAASDRPEFAPPPQPGLMRGLTVALLAHGLLLVALTFGVQWKREAENLSAEAELWASLPQQAAPKEEPPVVQAPPVVLAPPPPPVVQAPPPEPPVQRDAEIALEREKQRKLAEAEERREELERQRDKQKKLEALEKREELRKQKLQDARELAEARRKEEEKQRKLKELEAKKLAQQRQQDEKKVAQLREENLKRMQGMAGSGAQDSPGTAARSSGPSDSWAGRIRARVKPNIVFGDEVSGNPTAEVEVRMAPDGTIISKRLVKSSGVRSWDEAVLRALDKTEVLPRDVDGRVHSPVVIEFKPKG